MAARSALKHSPHPLHPSPMRRRRRGGEGCPIYLGRWPAWGLAPPPPPHAHRHDDETLMRRDPSSRVTQPPLGCNPSSPVMPQCPPHAMMSPGLTVWGVPTCEWTAPGHVAWPVGANMAPPAPPLSCPWPPWYLPPFCVRHADLRGHLSWAPMPPALVLMCWL